MMAVSLFTAMTMALAQAPPMPIRYEEIPRPFAIENDPVPRVRYGNSALRQRNSPRKLKKRKDKRNK
jgi:hypothetical protein